jgi:hypothetical protein
MFRANVPIIRRNNCIYATLGVFLYGRLSGMQVASCIPDSHPYRIASTKCRIKTVVSPDDGHIVARNINRREINIPRKIAHLVGFT